jgi:phospholipid/cholesterol/gamma-HCH transport system ATP-binding protein
VTNSMPTEQKQPYIQVEDLHKAFGSQIVLNGVGLEVREGETVAVMGRSGTGKSVLLKVLIGLQPPDSGTVSIHGRKVSDLETEDLNELRKKIGFLFQNAALYDSLTIEENVAFPMKRHSRAKAEDQQRHARELLAGVGIEQGLDKLPSQISGGMQKRVGLVRALALDPEILLLDEPTAGLDPITGREIANLIVDLKKQRGLTAVVVTHDIRGARAFADRIVLLHDGRIVAEGSFGDLQRSPEALVKQFFEDSS